MKAAWYTENGGPDVMQYGDLPDPEVRADTVVIAVEWISIEGGDLLNRLVTPPRVKPFVPGYQASGTVVEVGSGVTRFKAGDRVIGFDWHGSHASLFAVPEKYCYPVPDDLDLKDASTIPVAFGTASDALFEFGRLQPGETVLIQGAAGGVGLAAVQLASKAGATVIGTASSDERLSKLKEWGLDHGINYRTQDIADVCRELTGNTGVDGARHGGREGRFHPAQGDALSRTVRGDRCGDGRYAALRILRTDPPQRDRSCHFLRRRDAHPARPCPHRQLRAPHGPGRSGHADRTGLPALRSCRGAPLRGRGAPLRPRADAGLIQALLA